MALLRPSALAKERRMGSSESVSLEPSSEKPADPSPSDALPYASTWTVALAEESYGLILLTHCLEIQPR